MHPTWAFAISIAIAFSNRTLALAEIVPGQPSPPPTFIKVDEIDAEGGTLTFQYTQLKPVVEFKDNDLPQDSAESAPKFQTHIVPEQRMRKVPISELHFVDVAGKKVETNKALDRLNVGAILLRTDNAQALDDAYRNVLAKDVLILVLKMSP